MPFSTHLVVASPVRGDPQILIPAMFRLLGRAGRPSVSRTLGPSRGFALSQAASQGGDADPDEPTQFLGRARPTEIPALFREDTVLTVSLDDCPLLRRIEPAIVEASDGDPREALALDGLTFTVGEHDVFQAAFLDAPVLYGRYFVSLSFCARGLFADPDRALEQITAADSFREFRSAFRRSFGPDHCHVVRYD